MIAENSDIIALKAQADIDRFFRRVIQPALAEFDPGDDPPDGVVTDLNVLLDRAQAATHNALCYEMRRAFALVIGSSFERQLRLWLAAHNPDSRPEIERASLSELEGLIQELSDANLAIAGVEADVHELWLVTNAVRHGEGRSLRKLAEEKPLFWAHLVPAEHGTLEPTLAEMRLSDNDLARYTIAAIRFWAIAGASSIPSVPSPRSTTGR